LEISYVSDENVENVSVEHEMKIEEGFGIHFIMPFPGSINQNQVYNGKITKCNDSGNKIEVTYQVPNNNDVKIINLYRDRNLSVRPMLERNDSRIMKLFHEGPVYIIENTNITITLLKVMRFKTK